MPKLSHAKQITRAEFDKHCGAKRTSIPAGSSEVAWFVSKSGKYVGALLNHESDQYWGALVIDATAGHCCAIQVDIAIRSIDTAEELIDATFGVLERAPASPEESDCSSHDCTN